MARRVGNSNWGGAIQELPASQAAFERIVEQLRLTPEMYKSSPELKRWCEHNRNKCYVPEWLLEEWKIEVDITHGRDAA